MPSGVALEHPATPLLKHYATNGCPANVSYPITLDALEVAINWGAHPSARSLAAIAALHKEVQEKVALASFPGIL